MIKTGFQVTVKTCFSNNGVNMSFISTFKSCLV